VSKKRCPTRALVQVLEAAVTGLEPGKSYVLALAPEATGGGALQPLQGFMTNPAGAAVVNAIGPIRQLVRGEDEGPRRYLVIAPTHGRHQSYLEQVPPWSSSVTQSDPQRKCRDPLFDYLVGNGEQCGYTARLYKSAAEHRT
jgi:hypothetical protein